MAVERLTIAVPVYNERDRVESALKELLSTDFPVPVEIVVVDDASTDGTWDLLEAGSWPDTVSLQRHATNRGKGAALRTALAAATGDVFVPFDADLEYDPADIARLLVPLIRGESDLVFGTRGFGSHTAFNFWYVVGNKLLNLWANVLFNYYLSDLETCLKMVRVPILRSLALRSDGFDIEAEVTAKLLKAGYRPFEIPVRYQARTRAEGKKIGWRDGVIAVWTIAKIRFSRA